MLQNTPENTLKIPQDNDFQYRANYQWSEKAEYRKVETRKDSKSLPSTFPYEKCFFFFNIQETIVESDAGKWKKTKRKLKGLDFNLQNLKGWNTKVHTFSIALLILQWIFPYQSVINAILVGLHFQNRPRGKALKP